MPRLISRPPAELRVGPPSLAAVFEAHLVRQEEICAALEALADSLPHRFDTRAGLVLARGLGSTLRRAHRFEEEKVHPFLLSRHARLAVTLVRLRDEHIEDQDRANELQESVTGLVRDRARRDAEVVGYMLRGSFSGLGRHLAFEREHLLPLLTTE